MKSNLSIVPAEDVHRYFLSGEAVLFSEQTGRIFLLSETAAMLWCYLEEGLPVRRMRESLASVFGIPLDVAGRDILATLGTWERMGLVLRGPASRGKLNSGERQTAPRAGGPTGLGTRQRLSTKPARDVVAREAHIAEYGLLESRVRVQSRDRRVLDLIAPMFSHLRLRESTHVDFVLTVTRTPAGYAIDGNDAPLATVRRAAEIGPIVQAEMLLRAYERTDYLLSLHAGAVGNGRRCILLPGRSGSGKSTLVATLSAAGFAVLSDEVTLLQRQQRVVRPIPLSPTLKEGAWRVLEEFHPSLTDLPVHVRPDGSLVRYLPVRFPAPNALADVFQASCIVFPCYRPGKPTLLTRLSSAESLQRLTEAGYDVGSQLTPEVVRELVDWITAMDCYELQLSDLHQATARVRQLLQ